WRRAYPKLSAICDRFNGRSDLASTAAIIRYFNEIFGNSCVRRNNVRTPLFDSCSIFFNLLNNFWLRWTGSTKLFVGKKLSLPKKRSQCLQAVVGARRYLSAARHVA